MNENLTQKKGAFHSYIIYINLFINVVVIYL